MSESSTKLKICGITSLADARYCAGAGVDYLGFIQYPDSPRYIAPEQAKEIIGWLYGPETVGVFVNESADTINATAESTGFSLVQIHGEYPADFFRSIHKPVIKALAVHARTTPDALRQEMDKFSSSVDYFLLDTAKAGLWGGTGTAFDWNVARDLTADFPIFIAGGINASNIRQVIDTLHPFAVDLASGVEASPGVKDFDLLADLFDALKLSD